MSRKALWSVFVLASLCLLCLRQNALARTFLAEVKGVIRDSSGSVIPGVDVTLQNQDTNQTRTTTSTETGLYVFPSIPAGSYLLILEHAGLKKSQGKLILRVGQQATVDINLVVGAANVTVEVTDATPVVERSSATLFATVKWEQIKTFPLDGREITSLFTRDPRGYPYRRDTGQRGASGQCDVPGGWG